MNRGALLAACSLLLPTTLAAQASDTPQVLDPIVVTGTRTEHRISDSPVDVQLITAEDIQHSGARDVAELLEREGGVHVARVAGRDLLELPLLRCRACARWLELPQLGGPRCFPSAVY